MKQFVAILALLRLVGTVDADVTNLFPNGNFDSPAGTNAPWLEVFGGGTTTYNYPTSGGNPNGYGVMSNASGWGIWVGQSNPSTGYALAPLGLVAGGNYNFVMDLKNFSGTGIGKLKIECWASGVRINEGPEITAGAQSGAWATYTFNRTLVAGTTDIMIVPIAGAGSVIGYDNIGVVVASAPLAVTLTSPLNGTTVTSNFTIHANATISPGTVTNVSFYDGAALLGSDGSAPFSFNVSGAASGAHALKAIARDSSGNSATSSVVSITVSNPPPLAGWQLVWADEFTQPNGTSPDSSKWTNDIGGWGWGNGELQYYTARTNNARIENGHLVIEAKAENYLGSSYTSARLLTQNKWAWTYGRMEARIKVPRTQGIWPAFWMLGTNITGAGAVGWPTCGEIDIMEHIGREPKKVYGTVHGPGYSGGGGVGGSYTFVPDVADDFRVFAVEWTTNQIKWFVDGIQYFTVTPVSIGGNTWVFDHNHFLLLNVAVGGGWPGSPDETTLLPQSMLVDYVRVYTNVPVCVPPPAPTVGNNGPLWPGLTLNLTASTVPGATYTWTGPNGFSSTNQNPPLPNVTTNHSGVYSVTAVAGACTSLPAPTLVTINPPPRLNVESEANRIILNWPEGTLQSATQVVGPWNDVGGATSPRTNPTAATQEFYRLRWP